MARARYNGSDFRLRRRRHGPSRTESRPEYAVCARRGRPQLRAFLLLSSHAVTPSLTRLFESSPDGSAFLVLRRRLHRFDRCARSSLRAWRSERPVSRHTLPRSNWSDSAITTPSASRARAAAAIPSGCGRICLAPSNFSGRYGAPVCQYKVCSTFDSSPEIGSIDAALRIGREVFESACVPVVVAAPHLGRYVLFGNLFAAQSGTVYRIDRHPTMSRHPVTPMGESDLRLHLRAQGAGDVELVDILALTGTDPCAAADAILARNAGAVVFDGLDRRTELETGRMLWNRRRITSVRGRQLGSDSRLDALVERNRPDRPRVPAPGSRCR